MSIKVGIIFMFIGWSAHQAGAQLVYYTNPSYEIKMNPDNYGSEYYLVGKMKENILVGRKNEQGFYFSVYNDRMILRNNVVYKELNPLYFNVVGAANLKDIGVLFIEKTGAEGAAVLIYAVLFSDSGMPVSEAMLIDSVTSETQALRDYKVSVSEDRSYVFFTCLQHLGKDVRARSVLLDAEAVPLKHYQYRIVLDEKDKKINDFLVDNQGNVYWLYEQKTAKNASYALYSFALDSNRVTFTKVAYKQNLNFREMQMQINNFTWQILFYALHNGTKNELAGFYFLRYDTRAKQFIEEGILPFSDLKLRLKKAELDDLQLNQLVFLKDSGFIMNMQVAHTYYRSNNNSLGRAVPFSMGVGALGGGYGVMPGMSMGVPLGSGSGGSREYLSSDLYILSLDKKYRLRSVNTLKKEQRQAEENTYVGYKIMNTGNKLNYLYNNFLPSGDMQLSAYVLDPKYNLIRKPLAPVLNKNFSFLLHSGKQIASHSFLTPCMFKDQILCFALIKL